MILCLNIFLTGLVIGGLINTYIDLKCRPSRKESPVRYFLVAFFNGLIYVWVAVTVGWTWESLLFSICASVLLALGIIDGRTFEIPVECNWAIGILGVLRLLSDFYNWQDYLAGMCTVSGLLLIAYIVTKQKGIGGGDIKLMAAAGLLLGWEKIALALFMGSAAATAIHPVLMRLNGKNRVLAFGPYLALGIFVAMLYGDRLLIW